MTLTWDRKTIGDVCDVVNGATPKTGTAAFWDGQHQWVTPAEMGKRPSPYLDATARSLTTEGLDSCSASPVPPHSVIMSSRAPIGHLVINTVPMSFNQGCKGLVPRAGLNHKFLYYYLFSKVDHLNDLGTGATFKELSAGNLKKVAIPVPPLPEQQRIVGILDQAFEALAKAKANADRNLANAKEIYSSLLSATLSECSKDWKLHSLGDADLLTIIDGDRGANYPKKSDFSKHGYCIFLSTKNVRPDGFKLNELEFISEEKDKSLRKGKLNRGDVVMTTRGTLGNLGVYTEDIEFENIRINSGMLIFRPNKHKLDANFLFEILRSDIVQGQIREMQTGAAQPQLPITTLKHFKIPVPDSLIEQAQIVEKMAEIGPISERLIETAKSKFEALDRLQTSILHQAFSGNL